MTTSILGSNIQAKFEQMKSLLERGVSLARQCEDQNAETTLQDKLKSLGSAALFVIVGEVNAGKSSFINALLKENICEVAPNPCTARIQELVFAEQRSTTTLGDHWERRYLPSEVLKSISIVDTPGTNSIIRNHQTITEKYIPQSDLVVFVFPARNPHTNSGWELFSFIRREWHQKIVFILQQADVASQAELAINIDSVKQYARERNVQDPSIFAVSAKRENEGDSDSGFSEFREYLRRVVENGEVWQIKVDSARGTIKRIVDSLLSDLSADQTGLTQDKNFLESLKATIDSRKRKAQDLTKLIVDSLCSEYERLVSGLENDFTAGLEVGTILRRSIPLIRDKDVKSWLRDLENTFSEKAKTQIEAASQNASQNLCDEIQNLFETITQSIEAHKTQILDLKMPKTQDRAEIFDNLKQNLDGLQISEFATGEVLEGTQLGSLTLAGGAITALGTIITVVTNIAVLDITGGILAATGALMIAATLFWKRKSIVSNFKNRLNASRNEFRSRVNDKIDFLFRNLFLQLENKVSSPIQEIDAQVDALKPLLAKAEELKNDSNNI